MTRRTLTLAVVALMLLPAAFLRADDAAKGDKNLDGDWELKSMVSDGKERPDNAPNKPSMSIHDGALTIKDGDKTFKAKIKADPTKKPHAYDMTPEDGLLKGEDLKGIYEVKGDVLRLCHRGTSRKDPPTEFSGKDFGDVLEVWKRVKK